MGSQQSRRRCGEKEGQGSWWRLFYKKAGAKGTLLQRGKGHQKRYFSAAGTYRKKVVVGQRRREGAYNRTINMNVPFSKKEQQRSVRKIPTLQSEHFDCSVVCRDVDLPAEKDTHAPQAYTREKVVVSQRRYERTCKRIADANGLFHVRGGRTEWYEKSPRKAWAFE